jgi:hypothetical protein
MRKKEIILRVKPDGNVNIGDTIITFDQPKLKKSDFKKFAPTEPIKKTYLITGFVLERLEK